VKKIIFLRFKSLIKRWQLSWKFYFAHHPLCDRFKDHVWHIPFGIIVCQGCFLVMLGVVLGITSFFIFNPSLTSFEWFLFALFCISLPLMVELLKIENRKIKHLIRLVTGFGLAGLVWVVFTAELDGKIIAFVIGTMGYTLFLKTRKKKQGTDICEGCPSLSSVEICEGLSQKAIAMQQYSEYLTKIYEKSLKKKYSKT